MPVARLIGVTKGFRGVRAVEALELTLEPGRIHGLLGPNGAGKTTTMRILLGLLRPDAGTVELFGSPPDHHNRKRVGYVPETRALPDLARVEETLVFIGRLAGRTSTDARQRATLWIERLGLGHRSRARIDTLSNGERQKVQLAAALLNDPELLLLDEPLTALDPTHQETVLEVLRERVREGTCVLFSTHRLWEAEAIVDHVFLLQAGHKRLDAPLQSALAAARSGRYRLVVDGPVDWLAAEGVEIDEAHEGTVVFRCASLVPVLQRAADADARIVSLAAVTPSLHEIFLETVGA